MHRLRVALFCVALLASFVRDAARAADVQGCAHGGYRSPAGDIAAVTQPLPGRTAARYTLLNGNRGDTDAADSPIRCSGGVFVGRDGSGAPFLWKRIAFRATSTTFESEGATLYGLLLEPPDVVKPPLVVFVHGSEKTSDIGIYYEAMLTAQGVSTFFYDKRGTGKSTGAYTQDFILLAKDAANAAAAARKSQRAVSAASASSAEAKAAGLRRWLRRIRTSTFSKSDSASSGRRSNKISGKSTINSPKTDLGPTSCPTYIA